MVEATASPRGPSCGPPPAPFSLCSDHYNSVISRTLWNRRSVRHRGCSQHRSWVMRAACQAWGQFFHAQCSFPAVTVSLCSATHPPKGHLACFQLGTVTGEAARSLRVQANVLPVSGTDGPERNAQLCGTFHVPRNCPTAVAPAPAVLSEPLPRPWPARGPVAVATSAALTAGPRGLRVHGTMAEDGGHLCAWLPPSKETFSLVEPSCKAFTCL